MAKMKFVVVVALMLPSAFAQAGEVPFNALRFGSEYTTPSNWPGMREALVANRGAFDEVWFSTGVTFPPLAWHEERARQCAAAADDLRRIGIVPSIEMQTIIGHADAILASLMGTIVNGQSHAILPSAFLVASVHPCLSADDARFQICQ